MFIAEDNGLGIGMVDHIIQFVRLELVAYAHRNGAYLPKGVHHLKDPARVVQQHRNLIVRSNSQGQEGIGQSVDPLIQLMIGQCCTVTFNEGNLIRCRLSMGLHTNSSHRNHLRMIDGILKII